MTNKQKQYRERRRKGLCVVCGLPAVDGRCHCSFCAKKNSISSSESQKRRIKRLEDQIIALGGTIEKK